MDVHEMNRARDARTLRCRAGAALLVALAFALVPSGARAADCTTERWTGSWAASPSSASRASGDISAAGDVSFNPKLPVTASTTRSVLTPTLSGRAVRVTLSNRFGAAAVTFSHVAIGRSGDGASLQPDSSVDLAFGGSRAVTVKPGDDVTSDAATYALTAGARTAVSAFVAGDAGKPTEHFTSRQTSFLTAPGAGDSVADQDAVAFTNRTTTRPWVTRIDVRAAGRAGAVVAFGDSITDGYQSFGGQLIPEDPSTVDADARYPDYLARRLAAAGRALGVLNAGISGNRVLRDGGDGASGTTFEGFGPAALKRIDGDTPTDAGVTTVLFLEGINDLGTASAAEIIAGYRTLIDRWHARGLRVLQGTLEPNGSGSASRDAVNEWIRTKTTADGVIDFDAAVRDPADPNRIKAEYDGGDQLHYSPAGYEAMAAAVPLDRLADRACGSLRVRLSTRHIVAGRRTRVRVTVLRDAAPVLGARVRFAGVSRRTTARGAATLTVRVRRSGIRTLLVSTPEGTIARVRVRVRARPR